MFDFVTMLMADGASVIDWSTFSGEADNLVATITGSLSFILPVSIAMIAVNLVPKLMKKAGK